METNKMEAKKEETKIHQRKIKMNKEWNKKNFILKRKFHLAEAFIHSFEMYFLGNGWSCFLFNSNLIRFFIMIVDFY